MHSCDCFAGWRNGRIIIGPHIFRVFYMHNIPVLRFNESDIVYLLPPGV